MLNPIKNYLKNMISESKGYYDTNDSLQGFLEDLAKEHNIDIVLSEEEQKIIDDKIDNAMKAAHKDLKKTTDVLPPAIETYEVSHGGNVLTSPYHGVNEVKENKRLAEFIANKNR